MSKSTKAETQQRVKDVVRLIVQGIQRDGIRQYASRTWGTSTRQTDRYIAEATRQLAESGKTEIAAERGKALARYNDIYAKATEKGWLKIAIWAQERIDEVTGLTSKNPQAIAIANSGTQGGMQASDLDRVREVVAMTMRSAQAEAAAKGKPGDAGK